ncbi:7TM diverse intracellular signaling domain-containing protein [Pararhodonellum marinum]|uniref:7TM diverse intracellular signaling domain-containing protein n=1 Tax=Pararhodonellum marinum TaxID=2755358 RepID=UPI00188F7694|nr:7TM diverse intracellular signaling domain-containing protein [Pararhodonellum marinum]
MNGKIFFFLWLLILISFQGFGQSISGNFTLQIDDQLEERIYSIDQLEFFEDTTNTLEFHQIMDPKFQQHFKIRPSNNKNSFNTEHTYWVKLSVKLNPASKKSWLIEFYDQTIDDLEAYLPLEGGLYDHRRFGDALPFNTRDFKHKNFEMLLKNDREGIVNYYFRIRSDQKADIRIAVRSVNRFLFYALNEYFLYGIFYGMIAIICIYNLLVFLAIREIKYIYYILYLLSVAAYALCLDGIGFQYIWPNFPEFNQIANGFFRFSIVLWAVLFSIRFLNTKNRARYAHRILQVILGLNVLVLGMGLLIDKLFFEISYFDILPFVCVFITSIFILLKGYKVARFFVVAYGVLFVGILIKVLVSTSIIDHSTLGYYSLHLAFLLEMILLTMALGDRFRIMKEYRDMAMRKTLRQMEANNALKDKVNRELEAKVKERTRELEHKNQELEITNARILEKDEEIKRMNAILDQDNWRLKGKVRESIKMRLDNKQLSYEEFKSIFPEASACLRYLEAYKWKERKFQCRQCGNTKSSDGPKLFTKKCSKCAYIESVTAGTIFHGVRFPLEKAFFIAYSVLNPVEKLTLDELAGQLDMRKNTVWSFKKKVLSWTEESTFRWRDLLDEEKHKTGLLN